MSGVWEEGLARAAAARPPQCPAVSTTVGEYYRLRSPWASAQVSPRSGRRPTRWLPYVNACISGFWCCCRQHGQPHCASGVCNGNGYSAARTGISAAPGAGVGLTASVTGSGEALTSVATGAPTEAATVLGVGSTSARGRSDSAADGVSGCSAASVSACALIGVMVESITGAQVRSMTGAQDGSMTGAQVGSMTGTLDGSMTGAQVGSMTGAQVG